MYQALLAYSKILEIRGDNLGASTQLERAERLKKYFNSDWSVVEGSDMYAYAVDDKGVKHYEWVKIGSEIHGGESLKFIPLKCLTYPGKRNEKLLDYIFQKELDKATREDNIESLTYLPDMFFKQGQAARAWLWMKHIISLKDLPHEHETQGTNGDYPEISFTFISQTVEGIMGISVNAAEGTISICPQLPEEIGDAKLLGLKFGEYSVDISLDGNGISLKNNSPKPILWRCGENITVEPNSEKTMQK